MNGISIQTFLKNCFQDIFLSSLPSHKSWAGHCMRRARARALGTAKVSAGKVEDVPGGELVNLAKAQATLSIKVV